MAVNLAAIVALKKVNLLDQPGSADIDNGKGIRSPENFLQKTH